MSDLNSEHAFVLAGLQHGAWVELETAEPEEGDTPEDTVAYLEAMKGSMVSKLYAYSDVRIFSVPDFRAVNGRLSA